MDSLLLNLLRQVKHKLWQQTKAKNLQALPGTEDTGNIYQVESNKT